MNLSEMILNCKAYDGGTDETVRTIFAKRINGFFQSNSEVVALELTEEELGKDLNEIRDVKCPGYDYFMEVYLIQNLFDEIRELKEYQSDEEKVKRIIYYGEFDA